MSPRRRSIRWPWRFWIRKRVVHDVDEEIEFHLEMRSAKLEGSGMTPQAAREEALRQFGDVVETRTDCVGSDARRIRRAGRFGQLQEIGQDVVHGYRQIKNRPVYAVVAILTLAVGIGATTAVFSAADHVLLRPLPYSDAERVVTLWETDVVAGDLKKEVSPGNFLEWRERATAFGGMALAQPFGFDLTTPGEPPVSLGTWLVTEGFFEVLGVVPVLGRTFRPEEHVRGGNRVVIISHDFWQQHFGGDPAVIGSSMSLDLTPRTVVGILPRGIEYPEPNPMWAPMRFSPEEIADRSSSYMQAVGRLRPDRTLEEAQADMARVASSLGEDFPATNRNIGVSVIPIEEHVLGQVRPALLVLLGAVGFLMLIAAANVASLQLARGAAREGELAVRAALGAGRLRLIRQIAAETAVLAALGGVAGLAVSIAGVKLFSAFAPPELPRAATIVIDGRVLAFSVAVTVLSAFLFGLVPALRFSRPDLNSVLRTSGRSATAGKPHLRLRSALVITEISVALVLMISAGLLGRSFLRLLDNDLGFVSENIASVQMFIWGNNRSVEERLVRVREFRERFASLPGVEEVAVTTVLPFHHARIDVENPLVIEGRSQDETSAQRVHTTVASPNYFGVLRVPLRRGRFFSELDRMDAPRVVIINEALVRLFFREGDPLGQRVTIGVLGQPAATRTIVGVVENVRQTSLFQEPQPELFAPFAQSGAGSITFVVRTQGPPAAILPSLNDETWRVDPTQVIYHAGTLESMVADTLAGRKFNLVLLLSFSLIAFALAAIGIYGLISFSVSQRTTEIGVRVALGARREQVIRLIVGQAMRLSLYGVILGIGGAVLLTRFIQHMLYDVTPTDPAVFLQTAALMVVVATLAAYIPARRAASSDPLTALREE